MKKYEIVGSVTLQVGGEIEAESQQAAESKAVELLEAWSPNEALSVTDQRDYELEEAFEIGD